jgi:hypothetical protein
MSGPGRLKAAHPAASDIAAQDGLLDACERLSRVALPIGKAA